MRHETCLAPHASSSGPSLALRPHDLEFLRDIGLQDAHYEFLVARFFGSPYDPIVGGPRREWKSVRYPLGPKAILDHLAGNLWVGTKCRRDEGATGNATDYFIIDLDEGKQHPGPGVSYDLAARYRAVVEALGAPSFVFRSSYSGGLHVYYLLKRTVPLDVIRRQGGDGGRVIEQLARHGLVEGQGTLEVYPRGSYFNSSTKQWATENRIRLPFGVQSALLNPTSLTPYPDAAERSALPLAFTLYAGGAMHWCDLDGLLSPGNVPTRPAAPVPVPQSLVAKTKWRRRSPPRHARAPMELYDRACPEGLTGAGQLNQVASKLAFEALYARVQKDVAADSIWQWMLAHHHGQSRTINRDARHAEAEIRGVVDRVYQRLRPSVGTRESVLSQLEVTEIADVAQWTMQRSQAERRPKPYRLLQFLFALTQAHKDWLRVQVPLLRGNQNPIASGIQPWRDTTLETICCDVMQCRFAVPIPTSLLDNFRDFSRWIAHDCWRDVKALGLRPQVRPASVAASRAALYEVRLDFGTRSDPSIAYATVDEVLAAHFTVDEITSLGDNEMHADWAALQRAQPWVRAYPVEVDAVVADLLRRSMGPPQSLGDAA